MLHCNTGSAESAEAIARETLDRYGRIDIIVNNAGANLSPGGGFSTLSDEDWMRDWQINFMSAVRNNKALLPSMISRKSGVIINISTGAAKQPIWEMTIVLFFRKSRTECVQQSTGK